MKLIDSGTIQLSEPAILRAEIEEDQDGEFGLYIVPEGSEICITEAEMRAVLAYIDELKP